MNKISINLNPRREKIESVIAQNIIPFIPFMVLAAGVLFAIILILNFILLGKVNIYNSYNKKWRQWKDKAQLVAGIKKEMEELTAEKEEFGKITIPRYQIAMIFDDIFAVLPKNIWFQQLNFTEDSLNIKGYVVMWNEDYLTSLVDNFIRPLKGRKYFSSKFGKINVGESKKQIFNETEVLEFSVECAN